MTRDEIDWLARQAGLTFLIDAGAIDYLERFAARVADVERARTVLANCEVSKRQIAAEREACARVCRDLGRAHGVAFAEFDCVEAIRARGEG